MRSTTVGFLTNAKKRATALGAGAPFQVRRTDDQSVVFEGTAGPDVVASDTGEVVRFVNFDELTEPGEYVVTVNGGGKSREFRIGDDVFVEPLQAAMLGMYGLRCGSAVAFDWDNSTFGHRECHTDDAAPGGWHDAGDYGKYTTNGSFSLAMMLVAWDHFKDKLEPLELAIPERGGALPDFLDECRYQVEWLLGMQDPDTGGVHDRLTPFCESCTAQNQPFDPMNTMPESTTSDRRLAPVSTPATADFAAVVARAARAFEPYDAEFSAKARDAALAAWAYLVAHEAPEPPTNVKYTGYYLTGDADDRTWAAAEIWETTGDATALAEFERRSTMLGLRTDWDWADVQNLGFYTYLLSTRDGTRSGAIEAITDAAPRSGRGHVRNGGDARLRTQRRTAVLLGHQRCRGPHGHELRRRRTTHRGRRPEGAFSQRVRFSARPPARSKLLRTLVRDGHRSRSATFTAPSPFRRGRCRRPVARPAHRRTVGAEPGRHDGRPSRDIVAGRGGQLHDQ